MHIHYTDITQYSPTVDRVVLSPNKRKPIGFSIYTVGLTIFCIHQRYKRRIETQEKAKDVTAAWGAESINFFAALAILHQDELRNRIIAPGRCEE